MENREGPKRERDDNWESYTQLDGIEKGAEKALELIADYGADVVIYTDGSAAAVTSKGVAGGVVTRGDPENPTVVSEVKIKGRELTSPYEEREAMLSATEWKRKTAPDVRKVLIYSDSQSLVLFLNN